MLKSFLRDRLRLAPSVVLVMSGCAAHLALNAALRKPLTSGYGLLAALCLGIALESHEIWTHYGARGLFAPASDPLLTILARHAGDVAWVLAGPLLIYVVGLLVAPAKY